MSHSWRPRRPATTSSSARRMAAWSTIGALAASVLAPSGVASAAEPTTAAKDSFSRTVASGWGSAESGGAYAIFASQGVQFAVDGSAGQIANVEPGKSAEAVLPRVSAANVTSSAVFAYSTIPSSNFTVYQSIDVRRQANGNTYRGRLEVAAGGKATLSIFRKTTAGGTSLKREVLPFPVRAGQKVNLQVSATGSQPVAVTIKAWLEGTAAPAGVTASDTSSTRITEPGAVSLWQYLSAGSAQTLTTLVDSLTITKDPVVSTAPSPAPVPAPVPAPAPAPAPAVNQGSLPVGTAEYAVPAGALFVHPISGNDGASGAQSTPLRSLRAAVSKARAGQTIVLRGGTYNESVTIPFGKNLTVQSYPREAVWLDGSVPVTSWAASGGKWVSSGWNASFSSTLLGTPDNSRFVNPAYPLAARPDQVFLDGVKLRQVGSASAVTPGTFHVDYASDRLTLGDDPNGRQIRASNHSQALDIQAERTTLRGIGIRRYATEYDDRGTVRFHNVAATIENVVISDNAMIGLSIGNNNAIVNRISVLNNGMLGVNLNAAYGSRVTNTVIKGNNAERFKPAPVAGGIKITRTRDITVANNNTSENHGTGIWFDESCYNINVSNNVSSNNGEIGIELELSEKAIVANNKASNNKVSGILVFDSGNVKIYNNEMEANGVFGLQLSQDQRRNSNLSFEGRDPRQPSPDSSVPWLTRNITVSNNAFGRGGSFQFYALDKATRIPVDSMNVIINGNLFNKRAATSDPTMVAWGGNDNTTLYRYESPAALAQAKNGQWRNSITGGSVSLSQMAGDISAASTVAVPLPADVAAAIGRTAGTRVVGLIR